MLEQLGHSVSNVKIEQTENENDLKITQITFTNEFNGVTMTQTLFVQAVGDKNYVVTVTVSTPDEELVETVFETLCKAK